MARVTHSTLTRRTQTLGDYSPAGLKYRKDESTNGEIRAEAERPTSFIQICRSSFIHVRVDAHRIQNMPRTIKPGASFHLSNTSLCLV